MIRTLADLPRGSQGILDQLDVGPDVALRLMELGFLPGARVVALRSAPGGDPCVFQVDGTEVAIRRDTARRILLRAAP